MSLQKQQAIQATREGNWELAITINEAILREDPCDIETLNRLAFAYTVVGKVSYAKHIYERVLEIDIFNPIACKSLKRLSASLSLPNLPHQLLNNMFLEESGKTKIVTLINTAEPTVLQCLQIGQPLILCIKRLKIFVLDEKKNYIGMLPDNMSMRLIEFLDGGNVYDVYVKSVDGHSVCIFIREKKRNPRFQNQPTFGTGENQALVFKKTLGKK